MMKKGLLLDLANSPSVFGFSIFSLCFYLYPTTA